MQDAKSDDFKIKEQKPKRKLRKAEPEEPTVLSGYKVIGDMNRETILGKRSFGKVE